MGLFQPLNPQRVVSSTQETRVIQLQLFIHPSLTVTPPIPWKMMLERLRRVRPIGLLLFSCPLRHRRKGRLVLVAPERVQNIPPHPQK